MELVRNPNNTTSNIYVSQRLQINFVINDDVAARFFLSAAFVFSGAPPQQIFYGSENLRQLLDIFLLFFLIFFFFLVQTRRFIVSSPLLVYSQMRDESEFLTHGWVTDVLHLFTERVLL